MVAVPMHRFNIGAYLGIGLCEITTAAVRPLCILRMLSNGVKCNVNCSDLSITNAGIVAECLHCFGSSLR